MKNQTRSKKRGRLEEDNTQDSDSENCEFRSWSTWQLIDPLLPTGGFAHSGGLEAAANCGVVAGGDTRAERRGDVEVGWDVSTFAKESVANAISVNAPFIEASRVVFLELRKDLGGLNPGEDDSSTAIDVLVTEAVKQWTKLDRRLASRVVGNQVATRASTATGAAMLRAASAAFGWSEDKDEETENKRSSTEYGSFFSKPLTQTFKKLKAASRKESDRNSKLPGGHLATVFGAVCGALGFSTKHTARVYTYLTLRDTLSAATRLNLIGPLKAATELRRCVFFANAEAVKICDKLIKTRLNAQRKGQNVGLRLTALSASTSPLVDIVQGGHDFLYSRLFNS